MDAYYRLLLAIPLIVVAIVWAAVQYWYGEAREDKSLNRHVIKLKLR